MAINSVQQTRLEKAVRDIKLTPGWREIRRFMQAAVNSEDPHELDDVSVFIEELLGNAVTDEKKMATKGS